MMKKYCTLKEDQQLKVGAIMVTGTTTTEIWVNFVKEAQFLANTKLPENLESYTVLMLQRFTRRTDFDAVPFAIQCLEAGTKGMKFQRKMKLAETADASLIMAGFFPERARRLNVSDSYFMNISEMCYRELAQICEYLKCKKEAVDFQEIGDNILLIAGTLRAARNKQPYY